MTYVVGQFALWTSEELPKSCHPEQASFAQRGIFHPNARKGGARWDPDWARRFAPARERRASLFKLTHYRLAEPSSLLYGILVGGTA